MTRAWNEAIAALADLVRGGVPTLIFLSLVAALVVALAWSFWPRWLPWRWNWRFRRGEGRPSKDRRSKGRRTRVPGSRWRLGWRWRLRWPWRRRRRPEREDPEPAVAPDELPDLPAEVLVLSADQLAAQGRYAEAVRERLRAMIRELIERDIVPFSPGWTVTELATAARQARPALAVPLAGASAIFSEIWYGLRPARIEDDQAMRAHAGALHERLAEPATVGSDP